MRVKIEKTLIESAIHVIKLQAETETISVLKEYYWGLVDRLNEEVASSESEKSNKR